MARYDIPPSEIDTTGMQIAIVATQFNIRFVSGLIEGAMTTLAVHRVNRHVVPVVQVPGAFELPLAARWVARRGNVDAIIALGAVIQGHTPHFDYVCTETARGIQEASIAHDIPIAFGVLTCNNETEAKERSSGNDNNKGCEAALAALSMVALRRRLDAES